MKQLLVYRIYYNINFDGVYNVFLKILIKEKHSLCLLLLYAHSTLSSISYDWGYFLLLIHFFLCHYNASHFQVIRVEPRGWFVQHSIEVWYLIWFILLWWGFWHSCIHLGCFFQFLIIIIIWFWWHQFSFAFMPHHYANGAISHIFLLPLFLYHSWCNQVLWSPQMVQKIPPGGGTSNWRSHLQSEVTPLIKVTPLIRGGTSNWRWDLWLEAPMLNVGISYSFEKKEIIYCWIHQAITCLPGEM